jgi:hypothetical protein
MPEHLENSQNLVEEVQKYKDWNLIVFCWLMRALLTENSIWGRKDQNQMFMDLIKFIIGLIEFMEGLIERKIDF